MDDVVAIEVTTDSGHVCYFLTWGRIQDTSDPFSVEEVVLAAAAGCSTPGRPVSARLCGSLQEASSAPYFYESLIKIAQTPIPFGTDTYQPWRDSMRDAMTAGKQIFFVGPNRSAVEHAES